MAHDFLLEILWKFNEFYIDHIQEPLKIILDQRVQEIQMDLGLFFYFMIQALGC